MKKSPIFCLILVVMFCFSGCNWFGGGGGLKPGQGGDTGDYEDDRIQSGEIIPPSFDFEEDKYSKLELDQRKQLTKGIRATYVPNAAEKTEDEVLQADRDKFNFNAKYQYELLARTILHYLVGNYGYINGEEGKDFLYEFYADNSLLPNIDLEKTNVITDFLKPLLVNETILSGHDGAIEKQVNGILGEYNQDTQEWTISRDNTTEFKWNFCLDSEVGSTYNFAFIEKYTPFIQLNLMEYFVKGELNITPYTEMFGYNQDTFDSKMNELVLKIDKLGINADVYFAEFLKEYITFTVIGADAINRENKEFTYTEPSFTYQKQVEPVDPENPQFEDITIYYDMDNDETSHSITTSKFYKYDYLKTIENIVNKIAGEYDFDGFEIVAPISKDFPTYSRLEITDIDAGLFFNKSSETEIKKLNSMDYREYQSVVWYPDGVMVYDEKMNSSVNTEVKKWNFNMLNIYIDSKQDITLDIFMRIHFENDDQIKHIARQHTDSKSSFDFNVQKLGENGGFIDESFFDNTKMNAMLLYIPYFFGEEGILSNDGITNLNEKTFYSTENTFKNTFAGKMGSSAKFGHKLSVENYYGEMVNLSKFNLCKDSEDFVELIFVPKREEDITDYSFKFMLEDMLL